MELIPKEAEKFICDGSTVDFYILKENDLIIYYFDTSEKEPPHPMVNALVGLNLIKEDERLIMFNHKLPMGLFPKIKEKYNYIVEELKDGKFKIVFSKIKLT